MRKAFGVLLSVLLLQAGAAYALTADEVVARYVDARGGAQKLAALKSVRLTGKAVFGVGDFSLEARWAQLQKRPGMIRSEVTLQGLTAVEAYDGKGAWELQPFQGRREPNRTSADDARKLAQDADLEGPLVNYRAKGHRIDYLGTEDVDGTEAHKVRVALKDGDVQTIYLDPDSFLPIRIETARRVRGTEQVTETDLGSYAQVAGVWIAFSVESGAKGERRSARFTVEQAEPDVEVDDAVFKFPASGTPVGRAVLADPKAPALAQSAPPAAAKAAPAVIDAGVISGLGARNIGSATMSGRISALAARNEGGRTTLFVGAASGGVWKSLDGGTTFKPVFDTAPVQSIGAIALDPSNPKIVWVGSGESWTRNSVSAGDGIYKSTDGGESFTNVGLPQSERISKILVHPQKSDTVYACVPGKLWSDSPDRGVYKTTDGGKTWALILKGGNLSTGCSGLTMDPKNPEVLFAGLWDFRRKGWTFRSGGEGPDAASGSALLRSADGGKRWKDVSEHGLPPKPWGRIAVEVAPSDPKSVYALIEAQQSALFHSADGGATWEARDRSNAMVWRPFYFARLVIDPHDAKRLFKPDLQLIQSEDGGKSFANSAAQSSHGDWHDLWIDPDNVKHVIGGNDGGLFISWDGGNRWWKSNNLPVSQFYHVAVDGRDPYKVYGGLQDNSSWVGDSAYGGGISNARWENLYNADGFWVVPDPTDPDAVYAEGQGGYVGRIDRRTQSARDIQPKAGLHEKLRFNWNTPLHASPTQKGTLYIGAQFLFRSKDRGDNWERISPDLTTNDPEKQKQELSGGITVDNSAAETHTTIYSISESPKDPNQIWVGTDDGNLQLTRDAGKTWTNVVHNVPGLPAASWVSWVEASRFDPAVAYATFDRHTFGDLTPWVFRTADFGKTWTRIVSPQQGVRGYVHTIKEDTVTPQLLFVGTEYGLWISVDAGKSWAEFKGGKFPSVAVRDVQVHPRENDLVIATHGRGIWIVDDLTPLRALTPEVAASEAAFLPDRPVQQRIAAEGGWSEGDASFVGDNPSGGAVITYYQRARHLYGPIKLEIFDPQGKLVDTLTATKRRGLNRVAWQMQLPPPRVPRAASVAFSASQGPRVLPGTYTVRLTKGTQVIEEKLPVNLDRRATYGLAERKEQFDASMRVHAMFGAMSQLVDRIELAKQSAAARRKALPGGDVLGKTLAALEGRLDELKKIIVATKEGGAITGEERIREHADHLYGALIGYEGRPAKYLLERIDVLNRELDEVKAEFESVAARQIRPLDGELQRRKLEPIPTASTTASREPTPQAAPAEAWAVSCWSGRWDRCAAGSARASATRE